MAVNEAALRSSFLCINMVLQYFSWVKTGLTRFFAASYREFEPPTVSSMEIQMGINTVPYRELVSCFTFIGNDYRRIICGE